MKQKSSKKLTLKKFVRVDCWPAPPSPGFLTITCVDQLGILVFVYPFVKMKSVCGSAVSLSLSTLSSDSVVLRGGALV